MPRKVQQIPDYFTPEEATALVEGAPSYPTRMAFRIMLKTGLRVSEALALRRVDLRLDQDPPDHRGAGRLPGQQGTQGPRGPCAGRPGREPARPGVIPQQGPATADAGHLQVAPEPGYERDGPREVGIDPKRAHPHAFGHTYGRNCVLKGVPIPVLQKWLGHQSLKDTQRYVELAGAHHEWVARL